MAAAQLGGAYMHGTAEECLKGGTYSSVILATLESSVDVGVVMWTSNIVSRVCGFGSVGWG